MISSLRGTLISKQPTEILLDVGGVGYGVSIPLSTFERLGDVDSTISILTYLHVREEALQLFGFSTEDERTLFKLLISVSGIGPKIALGILSGITTTELKAHIITGNLTAMTSIPGVGKKTAERLVLELREKVAKQTDETIPLQAGRFLAADLRSEAILALVSLGYNRAAAEKAVRSAAKDLASEDLSIELLVKAALRQTVK